MATIPYSRGPRRTPGRRRLLATIGVVLVGASLWTGSPSYASATLVQQGTANLGLGDDTSVEQSITSVFPHGIRFGANTYNSIHILLTPRMHSGPDCRFLSPSPVRRSAS